MDTDDLIIGSGLSALATAMGLLANDNSKARVCVLAGNAQGGRFSHYDARATVPCAFDGPGGLGNDWHGVIPTALQTNFGACKPDEFAALFEQFYPGAGIAQRMGHPSLFVPWRPIRPWPRLQAMVLQHPSRMQLLGTACTQLRLVNGGVEATTAAGHAVRARRAWLAAGALHTPAMLSQATGQAMGTGMVSDHVFCYIGQADDLPAPRITHVRGGMFMPAQAVVRAGALYTLRPARFAFRQLDHGIEQRAVFGLPTGSVLAKMMKRLSPGLLAEAFYNRFGLWPAAPRYSIYAQVLVQDAYRLSGHAAQPLQPNLQALRQATDAARAAVPFAGVQASQRPDIMLPGIHLHASLCAQALQATGINEPDHPLQVVDASASRGIGPEHHSFKMMLAAYTRARTAATQCSGG